MCQIVTRDEDGHKIQLVHILKNGAKWQTYELITSQEIDLEQPEYMNAKVIYINDENIFIKTRKYAANFTDFIFIKAKIDAINNKIIQTQTMEEFRCPEEMDDYTIDEEIDDNEIIDQEIDDDEVEFMYRHCQLFGYSGKCHALLNGIIYPHGKSSWYNQINKKRKKQYIYTHCVYQNKINTFLIEDILDSFDTPKKSDLYFWIIVNKRTLYLFQSTYWSLKLNFEILDKAQLKLYSYHIDKDLNTFWNIEALDNVPISVWYNYDCYTFIRGYIVFFDAKKLDCGDTCSGIWLFNLLRKEFTESKLKMPSNSYKLYIQSYYIRK